ncbi:hypothetical protein ACS0TY_011952 [Phlomoides rotata]
MAGSEGDVPDQSVNHDRSVLRPRALEALNPQIRSPKPPNPQIGSPKPQNRKSVVLNSPVSAKITAVDGWRG